MMTYQEYQEYMKRENMRYNRAMKHGKKLMADKEYAEQIKSFLNPTFKLGFKRG